MQIVDRICAICVHCGRGGRAASLFEEFTLMPVTSMLRLRRALVRFAFGVPLFAAASLALAPAAAQAQTMSPDVVDTAVNAGDFTTLATALEAAGLVDTLKGPGPFTVFAPTDAAFAKLPAGTLDSLLADPDKLRAVLTYHV